MFPMPFGPEGLPLTNDIFVREAPYLPFASLRDGYAAFRRSSVQDGQVGMFSTGQLLQTKPSTGVVWWNINVWAKEILFSSTETPPSQQAVQGNAIQVSALKVRLNWTEFPSRQREIVVDIGSGLTISVGPTTQVGVELLVPDEEKFSGLIPTGLQNLLTATYVVTSCWAVQAPIGRPSGRATQAVYLQEPAQTTQLVPIADGARFVQVFADTVGGSLLTPPAFLANDDPTSRPLGRISFPIADFNTPKTEIAQNAKFISFTGAPGADTVLNVVQELEL